MLFEWMSTEINNAVDRHLKHAPRRISRSNIHSCMTEIRVGRKPPFTYWRAAAQHLSLFSLLLGTRPYTGFLSAYFLCILAFLQGFLSIESQFSCQLKWVFFIVASFFFFFKHVSLHVQFLSAFGWHTKSQTTKKKYNKSFWETLSISSCCVIITVLKLGVLARVPDKQSGHDIISLVDILKA